MKFVQHTNSNGGGAIKCYIPSPNGGTAAGKPKQDAIVFKPEVIDRIGNKQVHSGYTRLSDDEYQSLCRHSKFFTHAVEKGYLIVLDELPYSAQTPADIIAANKQEISDLKAQIEELKRKMSGTIVGEKLKELSTQLEASKQTVAEQAEEIRRLTVSADDGQTIAYLNAVLDEIDQSAVEEAKAIVNDRMATSSVSPEF